MEHSEINFFKFSRYFGLAGFLLGVPSFQGCQQQIAHARPLDKVNSSAARVSANGLNDYKDPNSQTALLDGSGGGTIPILIILPELVCSDITFRNSKGEIKKGLRNCNTSGIADCSSDGESNCVTTASFLPVAVDSINAASVKSGVTIAGVSGTMAGAPSCAADGESACVVDGAQYKAAKLANFAAADVRSGLSVAGVSGALSATAACTANGQQNCVVTGLFKAVDPTTIDATKMLSTQSFLGVTGSLASCSSSGSQSCYATGSYFGAEACSSEGASNCFLTAYVQTTQPYKSVNFDLVDAAKIRTSLTIASRQGTLADCSSDNGADCLTTTTFPSADPSSVVSSDLSSGKTVAGIAGNIASCSSDSATGCITNSSFLAADMTYALPGNIKSNIVIAGVTGNATAETHSNCASDNQSGCAATANYPTVNVSTLNAANIRRGVLIAGVTGTKRDAKLCTNGKGISYNGGSVSAPWNGTMAGVGTVSVTSGSTTVTGSSTSFSAYNSIGDYVTIGGETRTVSTITSTTVMDVDTPFTQTLTGQSFTIVNPTDVNNYTDDYQSGGQTTGTAPGTASVSSGSATVTGTGTSFLTDFGAGDQIVISGMNRTVLSVSSDTSMIVNATFTANANAAYSWNRIYKGARGNCNEDNFVDQTSASSPTKPDTSKHASWSRIFQDQLTGLYWTNVLSTSRKWSEALNDCAALNGGTGGSGWRLPGEKELLQAYLDGTPRIGGAFGNLNGDFYSSTSVSSYPNSIKGANFRSGPATLGRGQNGGVVCVRD